MMKRIKFGLVGIILCSLGITCFSNAFEYYFSPHDDYVFLSGSSFMFVKPGSGNTHKIDFYPSPGNCEWFVKVDDSHTYCYRYGGTILSVDSSAKWMIWRGNYEIYCSDLSSCILDLESRDDINVLSGMSNCPECETCSTTGDILSGYCDTNYCVQNDLCPVYDNNSVLYINEIEHESAPVINITIPLEYAWESSITSGVFDLSISGNNVDYDYIDNIIRTQQSKPNSVDFNNIVSELIPLLIPGLVIILFIWLIFRFIKKLF